MKEYCSSDGGYNGPAAQILSKRQDHRRRTVHNYGTRPHNYHGHRQHGSPDTRHRSPERKEPGHYGRTSSAFPVTTQIVTHGPHSQPLTSSRVHIVPSHETVRQHHRRDPIESESAHAATLKGIKIDPIAREDVEDREKELVELDETMSPNSDGEMDYIEDDDEVYNPESDQLSSQYERQSVYGKDSDRNNGPNPGQMVESGGALLTESPPYLRNLDRAHVVETVGLGALLNNGQTTPKVSRPLTTKALLEKESLATQSPIYVTRGLDPVSMSPYDPVNSMEDGQLTETSRDSEEQGHIYSGEFVSTEEGRGYNRLPHREGEGQVRSNLPPHHRELESDALPGSDLTGLARGADQGDGTLSDLTGALSEFSGSLEQGHKQDLSSQREYSGANSDDDEREYRSSGTHSEEMDNDRSTFIDSEMDTLSGEMIQNRHQRHGHGIHLESVGRPRIHHHTDMPELSPNPQRTMVPTQQRISMASSGVSPRQHSRMLQRMRNGFVTEETKPRVMTKSSRVHPILTSPKLPRRGNHQLSADNFSPEIMDRNGEQIETEIIPEYEWFQENRNVNGYDQQMTGSQLMPEIEDSRNVKRDNFDSGSDSPGFDLIRSDLSRPHVTSSSPPPVPGDVTSDREMMDVWLEKNHETREPELVIMDRKLRNGEILERPTASDELSHLTTHLHDLEQHYNDWQQREGRGTQGRGTRRHRNRPRIRSHVTQPKRQYKRDTSKVSTDLKENRKIDEIQKQSPSFYRFRGKRTMRQFLHTIPALSKTAKNSHLPNIT